MQVQSVKDRLHPESRLCFVSAAAEEKELQSSINEIWHAFASYCLYDGTTRAWTQQGGPLCDASPSSSVDNLPSVGVAEPFETPNNQPPLATEILCCPTHEPEVHALHPACGCDLPCPRGHGFGVRGSARLQCVTHFPLVVLRRAHSIIDDSRHQWPMDRRVASLSSKAASAESTAPGATLTQLSEEIEDCEGVQEELRAKPGELVCLTGL
jgi:hypothetical protein